MGRINKLESELRKHQSAIADYRKRWDRWKKIQATEDPAEAFELAYYMANTSGEGYHYHHPRPESETEYARKNGTSLYSLLTDPKDPITGHEAAALWFKGRADPTAPEWEATSHARWEAHYKLRLAYERQMLEAQGGRLEQEDVLPGGKLGGKLIIKVNKSPVTKRAKSCACLGPKVERWAYKVSNIPGTEYAEYTFDLERLDPGAYTPPTEESLAELKAFKATLKAARAATKPAPCPLVNPTDEDAERIQEAWNERARERHEAKGSWVKDFEPVTVRRMTQAEYSARSKGTYSRVETRPICRDMQPANQKTNLYSSAAEARAKRIGAPVCKLRVSGYEPLRVIILTDKPQKPLPKAVWQPLPAEDPAQVPTATDRVRHAIERTC